MSSSKRSLFDFIFVRPVPGTLLAFLLILGGVVGYGMMIKESLPDLELPQAVVSVEWPGAPPDLIEKQVVNEIEKKLKSLGGLKRLRSGSRDSFGVVAVEFEAGAPLDESMQQLRAKVGDAEAELPDGAKKPEIEQVSVTDAPIVTFALYGDVDPGTMARTAKDLEERLERIGGVKAADLQGERDEVVRVRLDPDRIRAMGISPTVVRDAIQRANLDSPLGRIEMEDMQSLTVKYEGQFADLHRLWTVPVKRLPGGRVVRLAEIADVDMGLEKENVRTFVSSRGADYKRGISISVKKTSGRDTVKLVEQSVALMEGYAAGPYWPQGLQWELVSDDAEIIHENLSTVFNNGWQAMLAVFVVLLFVLTWREALVAGLSIPVTFLGAVAAALAMGYTMNQLVIIGMVLALGMLVDVFILVMEGMHEGLFTLRLGFAESARRTVKTFAVPAFAGQMTTILAMAPLFAIGGVDGKFIRTIPATAIACLLISFVVAFLCCIPLSRKAFAGAVGAGKQDEGPSKSDRMAEAASARLGAWLLGGPLASRKVAGLWVAGAVVLFVLAMMAGGTLPSEMYPKSDGRNLGITVELAPGTQLEESQRIADKLGEVLRAKDYLQNVTMYVGAKSPFATGDISQSVTVKEDSGIIGFSALFTPKDRREMLAYEYVPQLRADMAAVLADVPGSLLLMTPSEGGSGGGDPVQVELFGDDMEGLRAMAVAVGAALKSVPGTSDVRDNLGGARTDVTLSPRREALDFYGISESDLTAQVRIGLENDAIGTFKMPGTEDNLDIVLGTQWPSRGDALGGPRLMEELAYLSIVAGDGRTVPLPVLASYSVGEGSQVIVHKDGRRSVTVSSRVEGRTPQEVLDDLRPVLERMKAHWGEGYGYGFGGEAEKSGETYATVPAALGMALFMVFAVLALVFDSFRQPFIIMLTVPFALTGTMGGFFLAWVPMSFPAMIGIIALIGIVVNNAIVMVETMNAHRAAGVPLKEAAARGAADRLRPIVSTTVTTLVGLVPLALSDPMWMPLCLAIICGLLVSTVTALAVIPCLYLLMGDTGTGGVEA